MVESPVAAHRARVMTYNVHAFVGTDGVSDPERTARVIEQGDADLVALQEVEFAPNLSERRAVLEWLASRLNMRCHFTLTRRGFQGADFGNVVLSRHAFELISEGCLPRRGGEARAVQWLKVRTPSRDFHVMNTHLSPWFWERHAQVHALIGTEWLIRAGTALPIVVCGDFNATPLSPVYRRLSRSLCDVQSFAARAAPTWPSWRPLLRIDHLFVSRDLRVLSSSVSRDELSRRASDHLPVIADIDLGTGPPPDAGGSDARPGDVA